MLTTQNLIDISSGAAGAVVVVIVAFYTYKKRRYNCAYFQRRWDKLEKHCIRQKTWYKAIIDADDLLNDALKIKRFKGKSVGERLVSAQRDLSSNHSVWFGHKLRIKIEEKKLRRISKKDTKHALAGYHKALKDLGALNGAARAEEAE